MTSVTVIVLTFQESIHIARAIANVSGWAQDVIVLDSGSTDETCALAAAAGAKVFSRAFDNYAAQRNYALQALPIQTDWVLFLDADEYLTEPLKLEITQTLSSTDCDGFFLKRRFYFMGKWIKYGGYYPTWILRLCRTGKGTYQRELNEHLHVDGRVGYLREDFVDHNLRGVRDWSDKHTRYAIFEANELRRVAADRDDDPFLKGRFFGTQAQRKQWIRYYVWGPLIPPLVRPFVYFVFRYFFRLGFLDGRAGLVYHFLHGCWYPFLIDVLYLENRKNDSQ